MCFEYAVTRRHILAGAIGGAIIFPLRALETIAAPNEEMIMLFDAPNQYTSDFFERAFDSIDNVAKQVGASLHIAFATAAGNLRFLTLSFEKKDKKGNAFPMLRKEDGSTLHLTHAGHGLLNRIEFSGVHREFLAQLKERTKRFFATLKEKMDNQDALTLGIKAVAIGIGLWIGIELAGFVLAALGFLLFYALMIALVIAGAIVIESFFQKRFSISERMADIKRRFMQKSTNFPELVRMIAS